MRERNDPSLYGEGATVTEDSFRLFIPGRPQAWKRVGRAGAFSFTPDVVRDYQDRIRHRARVAWGPEDTWDDFVRVEMWIAMPLTLKGNEPKPGRNGDGDNFEKGILDALEGIVYANDRWAWPLKVQRVKGRTIGATWIECTRAGGLEDLPDAPDWGHGA